MEEKGKRITLRRDIRKKKKEVECEKGRDSLRKFLYSFITIFKFMNPLLILFITSY